MAPIYGYLADLVLLAHFAFVMFVVIGFILIVAGGFCDWYWIRNSWFRLLHLVAIAFVAVQAWFAVICPLTILEIWLRKKAGDMAYEGSFIQYWVGQLLYYDFPGWVFVVSYTLFGLLVLLAYFVYPPDFMRRGDEPDA